MLLGPHLPSFSNEAKIYLAYYQSCTKYRPYTRQSKHPQLHPHHRGRYRRKPQPPRRKPQPHKTSEITIRIPGSEERKVISSLPNETIVQKVQQSYTEAQTVFAAHKLPSGDIRLYLTDERAKMDLVRELTMDNMLRNFQRGS